MSPEQLATLKHFAPSEFKHPDLVDYSAAAFLDRLRDAYGAPITLTSDARTREQNTKAGGSPTSLHLLGRAFDLRWPGSEQQAWSWLEAYFVALGWKPPADPRSVELELVHSATDKHIHFGFFPDDRPSRLIVAAE